MHYAYINGEILPIDQASIHITDLGLLRGYALFDYFRTYNGKPFQWEMYWKRFQESSAKMNIEIPITKQDAESVVKELFEKQHLEDCAFRFLLTGGFSLNSISSQKPNLIIRTENLPSVSPEEYETGMHVMTYSFVRDIPELKSTDYKHLLILQQKIKDAGCTDVLFHKDGLVSELSRSNVFHFSNGVLVTPSQNILNGITRQTVLQLAEKEFPIEIRDVSLEEFLSAEECFTTSSTKRILAITQIDGKKIGDGKPGPNTLKLQNKINSFTQNWGI